MSNILQINQELKNTMCSPTKEEYSLLEQSIIKEGCRDSLIIWEDTIVDGHNRYKICKKHNIDFTTKEMNFEDIDEAKLWIINNQLARRNLMDEQRKYYRGLKYEQRKNTEKFKGNQYTQSGGGQNVPCQNTAQQIADEEGVTDRTIKRDYQYKKSIDTIGNNLGEEVKSKILTGKLKLTDKDTKKIAEKTKEEQEQIIEMIEAGEVRNLKEAERKIKTEKVKAEIQKQKEEIEQNPMQPPDGKYDVIVIDPPWNYGTQYNAGGRRVGNPYPEMTQQELLELEIPSKEDSIIFLWTTHRFIWDAKELLNHWGFEYRNILVWNKEKIGMGDLFRMQCEFCLVGIKGKPLLDNDHTNRDIIEESRREHSRKPEAFYEMVNKLCVGRKLDYFSRQEREGWTVFGNDTNKF